MAEETLMRTGWLLLLAASIGCTLGANCVPPVIPNPPDKTPREALLRGFESEAELRSFMASQAKVRYQTSGGGNGGGWWLFPLLGAMPASAPMEGSADDAGDDRGFSTTNIQEEGVDESDLIKNDGEYIYMLSGDKIHVVKATPPESMAEVATLQVEPGGESMYLRDTTLVVISNRYSVWYGHDGGAGSTGGSSTGAGSSDEWGGGPWSDGAQATVAIFDVTEPANPASKKVFRFEGTIASSRLIGSKLHLVITTQPELPGDPSVEAIEAMTTDEWLPDVQIVSADGSASSGDVVNWQNALRPTDPDGYGLTVVATLDVDDVDAELSTTAVIGNVGTIYASTQALYLTDTQYSWDNYSSRSDTMIHKLAFTDACTQYIASGLVPGRPLNQYSMGEHKGYLRIATTNEQFRMTGETLSSAVYVLGVNNNSLDTVGKIENIAPGETIYSARFVGDRGFLVTFRRIDPLFTLDLSDPANPAIVGELKVPGYSDHIQMLDENHLLTIGRETEDAGDFAWVQGVLLTIFDVSDMASPKILTIGDTPARVEIGGRGTYSEANHNPKAFNYFAEKNVLAFPIDLYEGDTSGPQYGQHAFTGLYVYRVTVENGFEFLGRIASAEGVTQGGCFRGYHGTTRGVFIGDFVYSVTSNGVKAAPLASISSIAGEITFVGAEPPVLDCFWEPPSLALPPSADLR